MHEAVIRKVENETAIKQVAVLACEIWNRHYVPIVGQAQIDYMLDKFQSVNAITEQISAGAEYYLLENCNVPAGYFCLILSPQDNSALLSKLYLRQEMRGSGLGRVMLEYIEKRCRQANVQRLWLTVNRHNESSINFYRHMGFSNEGLLKQDIGAGFVMDDFKMAKKSADW